ncbi:sugar MFS transporter [Pseudomonas kurunegalensis]|uniref:sugar MFS transporter n=1 Tax=Pseudomonas kurunegalensis TaxID=485880 RepID=UPI003556F993
MSTPIEAVSQSQGASKPRALSVNQFAFILVTSLFFMWGFSHGLLDVLNKHFQDTLNISHAQSALAQTAYFGAYFFVALPVGIFMERFGYRAGILVGLALFAVGALLFLPAEWAGGFAPFLIALFVLASGLACLETAANLYATTLGDPAKAEQRLTLAQSFNGLGAFMGPIIGGSVFFMPSVDIGGIHAEPVSLTYVALAVVVVIMIAVFAKAELPEVKVEAKREMGEDASDCKASIWKYKNFTGALVAQFCSVGAYVGIGAFFINYAMDHWPGMSAKSAAYLLSLGMLAYMIGRFAGTWIMRYVPARSLLIFNSSMCALLCGMAVLGVSKVSALAIAVLYLFMSTLYPTIFAMGVRGLGAHTKRGGSYLVMALVGGAILPLAMGGIGDSFGTEWAFIVPLLCYVVIAWYGVNQPPIRNYK